ncbi:MAG: GIN domain-containing protein [Gammaproteobacteria bacterium]
MSALYIVLYTLVLCNAADARELEIGTAEYDADALRLESLRADVEVKVRQQDGVTVRLAGPQELAGAITARVEGSTLTLRQEKSSSTSVGDVSVITVGAGDGASKSVVTINGETVVAQGNGVVVVSGRKVRGKLSLEITVAPGAALDFRNFKGDATIGDVRGPLTLDTSGHVRVGEVTHTELHVRRSGDVYVASVTGELELEVAGNAAVAIAGGDVDVIKARVKSNGRASFGGLAMEAELSADGNGDLSVAAVDKRPRVHVSRNGRINVGNW